MFVEQARAEGLTFSAWLRTAAHARLQERRGAARFQSAADAAAFFRAIDERRGGGGREPEWEEHLRTMQASRDPGVDADAV